MKSEIQMICDDLPDCFEFAMNFLGEPEETKIRDYVNNLQKKIHFLRQWIITENGETAETIEAMFWDWLNAKSDAVNDLSK